MKNKTNLINCLLFLGILWFVFGCSDTNSDEQTNPRTQRPADSAPASITVNAGKLVIDFEGNEVRANQLYGGKHFMLVVVLL